MVGVVCIVPDVGPDMIKTAGSHRAASSDRIQDRLRDSSGLAPYRTMIVLPSRWQSTRRDVNRAQRVALSTGEPALGGESNDGFAKSGGRLATGRASSARAGC